MIAAPLPARFHQPLTAYTLAELQAHIDMHAVEVERVANVCAYYKRQVFTKHTQPKKAGKLRSVK